MKRLVFATVLTIYTTFLFAQCDLKTKQDQFTGATNISTGYFVLNRSFTEGTLKVKLSKNITPEDTTMTMFVLLEPMSMSCFGSGCKILLKCGETMIDMPLSGEVRCAAQGQTLIDYARLTADQIAFLKSNPVDAIRIYETEGYSDFSLKKNSDYFIRTLKCFDNGNH